MSPDDNNPDDEGIDDWRVWRDAVRAAKPRDDVDIIFDYRTALHNTSNGDDVRLPYQLAVELDGLLDRVKRKGKMGTKPKLEILHRYDDLILGRARERMAQLIQTQGMTKDEAQRLAAEEISARDKRTGGLSAARLEDLLDKNALTTKRVRPKRA